MKIVVAPDKFKNSITGLEFCTIVENALKKELPNINVEKLPLADGGDGTIDIVNFYLKGTKKKVIVNNPFFKPVKASYLFSKSTKIAFIEMAESSGLKLLKPEEFDCKNATTYGVGEMIIDAINNGANNIIMGIGGSATNDCGIGMATALGYRFLDKNNMDVKPIGANLSKIKAIDTSNVNSQLKNVKFKIACDVTNPLFGQNGAAHIYALQKGATINDVQILDKGLQEFSDVLKTRFKVNPNAKGAGAAGGMGLAAKLFLNGTLHSGIDLIKDLAKFDEKIKNTDWVITGEGKLDTQTLSGKTIKGVITSAKTQNIKIAAFCGHIALDDVALNNLGITYYDSILNHTTDINDAMSNSEHYLDSITRVFAKTI